MEDKFYDATETLDDPIIENTIIYNKIFNNHFEIDKYYDDIINFNSNHITTYNNNKNKNKLIHIFTILFIINLCINICIFSLFIINNNNNIKHLDVDNYIIFHNSIYNIIYDIIYFTLNILTFIIIANSIIILNVLSKYTLLLIYHTYKLLNYNFIIIIIKYLSIFISYILILLIFIIICYYIFKCTFYIILQ